MKVRSEVSTSMPPMNSDVTQIVAGGVIGVLTPWVLGSLIVHLLLKGTGRSNIFIVLGYGFLLGIFIATLLLRVFNSLGISFEVYLLQGALVFGTMLLAALVRSPRVVRNTIPEHPKRQSEIELLCIALLIALATHRLYLVSHEVFVRPLFAWDSWMNWHPKAAIWFHFGNLVDFVSPTNWLKLSHEEPTYTLGNSAAWNYPITVPLITLWMMINTASTSHGMLYLPWILLSLAIASIIYGHLRLLGVSPLFGSLAAYLLLSTPYINIHVALPGYADIWVAGVYTAIGLSIFEWQHTRRNSFLIISILMIVFCGTLKNPGIVLSCLSILALILFQLINRTRTAIAILVFGVTVLILASWFDTSLTIPVIGTFGIEGNIITISSLGEFALNYHPVTPYILEALFVSMQWNLLWYFLVLTVFLATVRRQKFIMLSADFLLIVLCLTFIIFAFSFTEHSRNAYNFMSINRSFLYLAPLSIFFIFRAVNLLKGQHAKAETVLAPP